MRGTLPWLSIPASARSKARPRYGAVAGKTETASEPKVEVTAHF